MKRVERGAAIGRSRKRRHGGITKGAFLGTVLAAGLVMAGPARAQTSDEQDKPYPPSWYFSGFYWGFFFGHYNPSLHAKQDGAKLATKPGNGEGGASLGYGWRLGERTVLGIDGEVVFINLGAQGLIDDNVIDIILDAALPDATVSVGVRLGYAVTDRLFVYGRAGWSTLAFGTKANQDFNGVRVNGGAEVRIWKGLALRLELIHDEYDRKRFAQGVSLRPSATSFRGGLTYHF